MITIKANGFTGQLEHVSCPTCDEPQMPKLIFTMKNGVGIWKCPDCEILYASPRFSEASLLRIYESEKFLNRQTISELEDWFYSYWKASQCRSYITTSLVVSLVKEYIDQGCRLLDVGSAMGYFVYESIMQGYKTEGIEPSKMLVDLARKKLNLSLHNCSINSFVTTHKFSGIILWDVLEHVYSPMDLLRQCGRFVEPDALLFIQVPNYFGISDRFKSFLHRVYLKNNDFKHFGFPWHVYSFNRNSLTKMLGKSGFKPIRFESWSHNLKEGKSGLLARSDDFLKKYCLSDYIVCIARFEGVNLDGDI